MLTPSTDTEPESSFSMRRRAETRNYITPCTAAINNLYKDGPHKAVTRGWTSHHPRISNFRRRKIMPE